MRELLYRIYRRLLFVYPWEFRSDFARDMVDTLREREAEVRERDNWFSLLRFWWRELAAVTRSGLRLRLEKKRASRPTGRHRRPRRRYQSAIDTLIQDVRFTFRNLRKRPVFTLVAVLTLGLGIGAATAMFSVVDGVLLKPLAYENPDRILLLWERRPSMDFTAVSYLNFLDWRRMSTVFTSMAAYRRLPMNLTGDGDPARVETALFSASAFDVLGTKPLIGRAFHPEEDREGASPVTILSYGLWQNRFGGDPAVLGRSITLDGIQVVVVGVMPPAFQFPPANDRVQLFLPLETFMADRYTGFVTDASARRWRIGLRVVARLGPDRTLEDARAETDALARQLEEAYPEANPGVRIGVEPLHAYLTKSSRQPLLLLLAAVGGLMLIACANVANLLLGRVSTREREMAVRTALGAGGGRLVRMLLTESIVLWLSGGLFGLGLAYAMKQVLVSSLGTTLPRLSQCAIDHRATTVALAVSLLTGCLFGLIPALRTMRTGLQDSLRTRGYGAARYRMRSGLVVVEVSLAVVLLVGAGLTIRTFQNLIGTSPGLDPQGVLAVRLALPDGEGSKYWPKKTQNEINWGTLENFYNGLLERVRAMPAVDTAATTWYLPLSGAGWEPHFHIEGWPAEKPGAAAMAEATWVSPDFFRTMGIPLLAGRDFTVHDSADAPLVVIVDEKIADHYWPGQDPVGKRLKLGDHASDNPWLEVVGVVGHVKLDGVQEEALWQLYVPESQRLFGRLRFYVVAKTTGEPTALVEPIRRVVEALDPDLPVSSFRTMEDYVGSTTQQGRLIAGLLGIFAATALILAGVGLYGVMSGVAAERTREIAVRMAIGARGGQVVGMILRQAMTSVVIGAALGLTLSMILSRLAKSLLFGITHLDPATYFGAFIFLFVVAILASAVPAFRATTVDPMSELRTE